MGKQGGYLGNNVPLTIYLDVPRGEATQPEEVVRIANSFEWPHGPKSVAQLVESALLHLQTLVPPESPGGTLAHPTHGAAVSILEARRGLSSAGFRRLTRSSGCCHAGLEQLHVARSPTRPCRRRVRIRVSCVHAEDGHGEVRLGRLY